jgi:Tol biopolymer transport system component
MALATGARLGVYEIVALLGTGGMGRVYRARDTKLGRDVALKVLPDSLAHDVERLARFEREAHVLAALNHPHIAHIHGFEDSTDMPALVMELVEGSTLAERIAQGPIPVQEALPIARQIAEALEAAHGQGIIHRDLKPANIKVRDDGTVKVLDFGLAKAFDPSASSGAGATMSPTLSIHGTEAGIILGTAAYMAPEQARGKGVDTRADIWAFGVVLYEMLTGRRPFDGDDLSITLAAVLKADPDWQVLPLATPASLRRMLSRCLRKDPKDRLQAIGDARVEIAELINGVTDPVTTPIVPAGQLWRRTITAAAAVFLSGAIAFAIGWFAARRTVTPPRVWRFQITPPSSAALTINGIGRDVALTPDGSRLIYVGANGTTLFVRPIDQLEATPLVRGGALRDPFVSPDAQWVGFFDGPQTLKKVALNGGPAVLITQVDSFEQGATWSPDGTIIVAVTETGLQRVSADGGVPAVLTRPDRTRGEANHRWPEILPGGHAVLYTATATTGGPDAASIAVLDLKSGRSTILLRGGSHAQYAATGHLMYAAAGALRAVAFDSTRMILLGMARPVVPQVLMTALGDAEATLAPDGTLVYVAAGEGNGVARTLVWVDRQGRETPIPAPARPYGFPQVCPNSPRIAVTSIDQNTDIWLWDSGHATLTRVTSDPAIDTNPISMPDGRRVVFGSNRFGAFNLFTTAAEGTGALERLTKSSTSRFPLVSRPIVRDSSSQNGRAQQVPT